MERWVNREVDKWVDRVEGAGEKGKDGWKKGRMAGGRERGREGWKDGGGQEEYWADGWKDK